MRFFCFTNVNTFLKIVTVRFQLNSHVIRLMDDHFGNCATQRVIDQYSSKLQKLIQRSERYFNDCGEYDPNSPNGVADRKRREIDEERYDPNDGPASVGGIASGIRNFAKRYLKNCSKGGQNIVEHAAKWRMKLETKLSKC
jgi:hypothetical protein